MPCHLPLTTLDYYKDVHISISSQLPVLQKILCLTFYSEVKIRPGNRILGLDFVDDGPLLIDNAKVIFAVLNDLMMKTSR